MAATIASLTPTVCRLLRIAPPALSGEPALPAIEARAAEVFGESAAERILVYCPDALGDHLWRRFPEEAAKVAACCPERVHVRSVVPPVTPVCFSSVFTGAAPEEHGVRTPDRRVLARDTLFDALIRAGRRVAIVAVRGSSIERMFRERPADYFAEKYDEEVSARTLELLAADAHDVIVAYHQEYDDRLHRTEPFSEECLRAFRNHVGAVARLAGTAGDAWSGRRHAVIVAPDHGAHANPETGRGDHGRDIPEDMEVSHWYGLRVGVAGKRWSRA